MSFSQLKGKDDQVIGRISKQWSGLLKEVFTDTDNFGIQFPMDLDVKMKAVLMGACFLIVSSTCSCLFLLILITWDVTLVSLRLLVLCLCRTSCSSRRWETPTSAAPSSHNWRKPRTRLRLHSFSLCFYSPHSPAPLESIKQAVRGRLLPIRFNPSGKSVQSPVPETVLNISTSCRVRQSVSLSTFYNLLFYEAFIARVVQYYCGCGKCDNRFVLSKF